MATDEEYLDNLLKSMTEGDASSRTMDDVMKSMNAEEKEAQDDFSLNSNDLADMLDKIEETESAQPVIEEIQDELSSNTADAPIFRDMEEFVSTESEKEVFGEPTESEPDREWDAVIPERSTEPTEDLDVTELIDNMEHAEDDLLEINDLLKKSDQNEYIEPDNEDMEALFSSLQTDPLDFLNAESTAVSQNADTAVGGEQLEPGEKENKPGTGKSKKFLFGKKKGKASKEERKDAEGIRNKKPLFGKRKKKEQEAELPKNVNDTPIDDDMNAAAEVSAFMEAFKEIPSEGEEQISTDEILVQEETFPREDFLMQEEMLPPEDALMQEEMLSSEDALMQEEMISRETAWAPEELLTKEAAEDREETEGQNNRKAASKRKKGGEKKKSFFAKFLEYLAQDEEEESVGDENTEILEELAREDQKAAKEKEKKKKGEKKQKPKKEKAAKNDNDEKKLAKKQAREEKKKERQESAAAEKSVKVLGKKGTIVLVAFCISVVAAVFSLSTFLPEYVDKQDARTAFYIGDYEQVYKLLYGKNLNANEQLLFDRAEVVLIMERKLKSYENNRILDRPMEALDALIQGVVSYGRLKQVDEVGAREEVDIVYEQICSILDREYGLSPEAALEISSYESIDYTRALQALISGENLGMMQENGISGESEDTERILPEDILPEEEEFLADPGV